MRINMTPKKGALLPLYSSDLKKVQGLEEKAYSVTVSTPRNLKLHNKMMALLRLFVRTTQDDRFQPRSPSSGDEQAAMDRALDALKYELNLTVQVLGFDGEVRERPKSISFESMDNDEFYETCYNPAVIRLAKELGCTVEDIEKNLVFNL